MILPSEQVGLWETKSAKNCERADYGCEISWDMLPVQVVPIRSDGDCATKSVPDAVRNE